MADAKKCDRCGAYYDNYDTRKSSDKIIGIRVYKDWLMTGKGYDLCDDCAEQLCEFMNIKRE